MSMLKTKHDYYAMEQSKKKKISMARAYCKSIACSKNTKPLKYWKKKGGNSKKQQKIFQTMAQKDKSFLCMKAKYEKYGRHMTRNVIGDGTKNNCFIIE